MTATIHLRPAAPLAERVLLPGDPGRALRLAEVLLERPQLFNEHRGLLGYTGTAPDGAPLSIQSSGMGGPSAAIVVSELVALGARRLLRVGTCGALHASLALGDLLIATEALAQDGTSRALGAGDRVPASAALLDALRAAAPTQPPEAPGAAAPTQPPEALQAASRPSEPPLVEGAVVSTDLFYDERGLEHQWAAAGALAVEMETATLFTLAPRLGVEAGAVLAVTDLLEPARKRISAPELAIAEWRLATLVGNRFAVP